MVDTLAAGQSRWRAALTFMMRKSIKTCPTLVIPDPVVANAAKTYLEDYLLWLLFIFRKMLQRQWFGVFHHVFEGIIKF